ncbi:hypothetical protein [Fodinibius sp.]|uniref:hypothetical protein n=1 Tax=Fodinibius sp. TaxID=1872440 RepID=UPI002ACD9EAA|nr:hypothetical protein [Fodinibius sp.]MDZ7659660.1 hypothetical protein [Fodinibius sp.]
MMKPVYKFLTLILSMSFLFFNALLVQGQIAINKDCTCPEVAIADQSVLILIGADDYPNFLNISGLKKYSNINYDGLINLPLKEGTYTVKGSDNQVELLATYNIKDGSLISGHYITKNTPLPKVILVTLVEDHKGWTMTRNKTIVHDFDAQRTEYQVKMRDGKNKQILYFDHSGKPIKKLSRI